MAAEIRGGNIRNAFRVTLLLLVGVFGAACGSTDAGGSGVADVNAGDSAESETDGSAAADQSTGSSSTTGSENTEGATPGDTSASGDTADAEDSSASTSGDTTEPANDKPAESPVVMDDQEREASRWPDTATQVMLNDMSYSLFDDLAVVTLSSVFDGTISSLEVKSIDGSYCQTFLDLKLGSTFLVTMGIGYVGVVNVVAPAGDRHAVGVDFIAPATDVSARGHLAIRAKCVVWTSHNEVNRGLGEVEVTHLAHMAR